MGTLPNGWWTHSTMEGGGAFVHFTLSILLFYWPPFVHMRSPLCHGKVPDTERCFRRLCVALLLQSQLRSVPILVDAWLVANACDCFHFLDWHEEGKAGCKYCKKFAPWACKHFKKATGTLKVEKIMWGGCIGRFFRARTITYNHVQSRTITYNHVIFGPPLST